MRRKMFFILVVVAMLLMSTVEAQAVGYGTGVYVNGYQLTSSELMQLQQMVGRVPPGYYWLDRSGNIGAVGNSCGVNVYTLTQFCYGPVQPPDPGVNRPVPDADALPVVSGIPGPNGDGSYGPFATIRRALEVVRMFKSMGYPNTIQYHNGDGQYVFPRR